MGPIKGSLREAFFSALFGGDEVRSGLREILGRSVKCGGLGITDPWLSVEHTYNTFKASSEVLVGSLLGGTNLNYVEYKDCVCILSLGDQKQRDYSEKEVLTRRKDVAYRTGLNCLRQAIENWVWLKAIPQLLNGMELSREEFQDNIFSLVILCP